MLGCAFGCNDKINLGAGSISGKLPDMDQEPPHAMNSHSIMHMVNIHSLNSIGFDKMKSVQSASVARYLYNLAKHNESVIFCGKINDAVLDEHDLYNQESLHPIATIMRLKARFSGSIRATISRRP